MDHHPLCEHPRTAGGPVCPICLQMTWQRAAAAIEQAIVTKRACATARKDRGQDRPTAGPENEAAIAGTDAGLAECGLAPLDYVLPSLDEVLNLTQGRQRRPPAGRASRIYVWGYAPLHGLPFQNQAKPTAAAGEFAAARGWDATRPGAWALELELPLPLSRALDELEPAIRRDAAVRGWGGCSSGCARQPAPRARPQPAAAIYRHAAQSLCERAQALSATLAIVKARHLEVKQQVRTGRLERLKRLPPAEFDALNRTLTAAIDLGKAGQLTEGYTLLLSSWHHATAAAQHGVPWSGSLRWIYSVALENYVWRYGPSLA